MLSNCFQIWLFPKIGVPQNGWFIMDDLGVPLFSESIDWWVRLLGEILQQRIISITLILRRVSCMFRLICRGARVLLIPTIFDSSLISVDLNSLWFTLINVNRGMIIYASIFFSWSCFLVRMRGTFKRPGVFLNAIDTDFSFNAPWACYGIFKIHIYMLFSSSG